MKKEFCKKIALLLICAAVLGVTGCGDREKQPEDTNATEEATGAEEPAARADILQTAFVTADNAPSVAAGAAVLVERESKTILYDKNAKEKIYPASMTKMITALVVMDHFSPEELITVGAEINEVSLDSSKAGHIVGETLTVKNLIRGLIIPSGNDSANVLATAVAKRAENDENMTFSRCEEVFAELMNEKAEELGAINTHFTNAHGYHDEDHYSCAYDMALFADSFLDNETLKEIADERSFSGNGADNMFSADEGIVTQDYVWRSHNLLITDNEYNYSYASGIKTGFTDEAGQCVTATAEKDGETLICVISNSTEPERWTDATSLFEYGFNGYERVELATTMGKLEEVALTKNDPLGGDTVDAVCGRDIITYLPTGVKEGITTELEYNEEIATKDDGAVSLKAPLSMGQKIGAVTFKLNGKALLTENVFAGRDVEKASIFDYIKYFFVNFGSIVFSLKGLIALIVIVIIVIIILLLLRLKKRSRKSYSGAYTFGKSLGGGRVKRRRNRFRR